MSNRSNSIQMGIAEMLRNTFHQSEQILDPENWNKPLTGSPFRLSGVDMVYLFFELEKTFNVQFMQKHLQNYGFLTLDKIAQAVQYCALQPSNV